MPGELPADESPLRPRNPYAVSKLAAEALCWQRHVSDGMDVVLARPFNHIGACRATFQVSDFAHQIAWSRAVASRRRYASAISTSPAISPMSAMSRRRISRCWNAASGRGLQRVLVCREQLVVDPAHHAAAGRRAIEAERPATDEQRRRQTSADRAATGWHASTPLSASLQAALQSWEGGS